MSNNNESVKKFIEGAKAFLEGLNRYSEKIKKRNKIAESEKEQNLFKEFEAIDKNSDIYQMFKAAEYDAPTDEEIKAAADKQTALKYYGEKDKIIDSLAKAYSRLEKDREKAYSDAEKKQRTEAIDYDEKISRAQKQATRQGLARSSVVTEQVKQLAGEKAFGEDEIQSALQIRIREIEEEIAAAQDKKQKALNEYDASYAAELEKSIAKLKQQREDKIQQALKYNNQLKEKEKKYFSSEQGAAELLKAQEQKLDAAKKFYDGMTKQQALQHITGNEAMKKHLGVYYAYMLNYINNKK